MHFSGSRKVALIGSIYLQCRLWPWYSMNLTTARRLKLMLLGHFLFGLVFCVKSLVAQVSRLEAFLCGVCTFSPCTPASPNLKNMPVRQIGKSKVAIGVSVSSFLWFFFYGPAMNCRLVHSATLPSPAQ